MEIEFQACIQLGDWYEVVLSLWSIFMYERRNTILSVKYCGHGMKKGTVFTVKLCSPSSAELLPIPLLTRE
jgi:hypothetical protein